MDRSYLILLFGISFFLVLVGVGLYGRYVHPTPAATQPTTQATVPLVDRLREERERRMRERGELPPITTQPSTMPAATNPA
jgi:hypothetical protein